MKIRSIVGFYSLLLLVSCSKDQPAVQLPEASFGVQMPENKVDTSAVIVWPTWVNLFMVNYSEDGGGYTWNFGNGKTSEENEPATVYESPGDYQITLTVVKNGQTSQQQKIIRVVERSIKTVTVNSLNWNTAFHTNLNWPVDKAADVFFRVYKWDGAGFPTISGEHYQGTTLIYESPMKLSVKPSDGPFTLAVNTPDLVLQHPAANSTKYGYCLYTKDQGQEYLLLSNWGFGLSNPFFEDYRYKQCYLDLGIAGTQFRITGAYGN